MNTRNDRFGSTYWLRYKTQPAPGAGFKLSARNRNRTCTPFRKQDFESSASTNSAIRAMQQERKSTLIGVSNIHAQLLRNNDFYF